MTAALLCLLTILVTASTYGFDVTAYGRVNRVAGFQSRDACWVQHEIMTRQHPEWALGLCVTDRPATAQPPPERVQKP